MTNLAKIGIVLATGTIVVVGGGTAIYVTMNHNPIFPDSITNQDGSIDVKFSYNVFLLSEQPNVTTESPKPEDTFGYRYWYLLVDPDKRENEDWWKRSYQELRDSSNNSDTPFKDVKSAFHRSSNNGKALNQTCKDLHSQADNSFTSASTTDDDHTKKFVSLNDQSLSKNFWKYCSVLGRKPSTLEVSKKEESTESPESQKYSIKDFTNILVSTTDGENDLFWRIKNDWVQRNKESILDSFNWFYKAIATKMINKHTLALQKICQYAQSYIFKDKSLFEFYLKGCSFVDYPFSFK